MRKDFFNNRKVNIKMPVMLLTGVAMCSMVFGKAEEKSSTVLDRLDSADGVDKIKPSADIENTPSLNVGISYINNKINFKIEGKQAYTYKIYKKGYMQNNNKNVIEINGETFGLMVDSQEPSISIDADNFISTPVVTISDINKKGNIIISSTSKVDAESKFYVEAIDRNGKVINVSEVFNINEKDYIAGYSYIVSSSKEDAPDEIIDFKNKETIVAPTEEKYLHISAISKNGLISKVEHVKLKSYKIEDLKLEASINDKAEYISLDWGSKDKRIDKSKYKIYRKKIGEEYYPLSVGENKSNEKIKVLNVHMDSKDELQLKYKTNKKTISIPYVARLNKVVDEVMEDNGYSYGKDLFEIENRSISEILKNAQEGLKDSKGRWEYDVIVLGVDGTDWKVDITSELYEVLKSFVDDGMGLLISNDVVKNDSRIYSLVEQMRVANNASYNQKSQEIEKIKSGELLEYPWRVESIDNLELNTKDSLLIGKDNVWLKNQGEKYYSYLATNENIAILQDDIGDSMSSASKKLLVNTLFHLSQVSEDTHFKDLSAKDMDSPQEPSIKVEKISKGLFRRNKYKINLTSKDTSTKYKYVVKTLNDGYVAESNEVEVELESGVGGYSYVVDDDPNTIPDDEIDIKNDEIKITTDKKYLHIKSIDKSGNVSNAIHYELPAEIENKKEQSYNKNISSNSENAKSTSSAVPQVKVDNIDFTTPKKPKVELSWAVDMPEANVFWETGFEKVDQPNIDLVYDAKNGKGTGGQEFSTNAYSGSYAYYSAPSIPDKGNWSLAPIYPSTINNHTYFRGKTISGKNGELISISYMLKTTDKSKIQVLGNWQYEKHLTKNGVTVTQDYPKGSTVISVSDVVALRKSGKYTGHVTFENEPSITSNTYRIAQTRSDNTILITPALKKPISKGAMIYDRQSNYMFGEDVSYRNTNNKWEIINYNTEITNNPYINWEDFNVELRMGVASYGETWIDNLKVGFTPQVIVKKDGKQIYSGYAGEFVDANVVDDVKPEKVSNIKGAVTTSGSVTVTFTCNDLGNKYTYTATSKDKAGNVSSASTPITANVTTGIAGYSYSISKNATDEPDNKVDIGVNRIVLGMPVEDGNYIHIKAIDNAGNVGETAHYKLPYDDTLTATVPIVKIDKIDYTSYTEPIVNVSWAVDMPKANVFWETGFEKADQPDIDLVYDKNNGKGTGGQEFSKSSFSGSYALYSPVTMPNLGNWSLPPNYPDAATNHVYFRGKTITGTGGDLITTSYRLKTSDRARVQVRGDWEYEKRLKDSGVTVAEDYPKGTKVIKVTNTGAFSPNSMNKGYITFENNPDDTSNTYRIPQKDTEAGTITLNKGIKEAIAKGTKIYYREGIYMFGSDTTYRNTNNKWELVNFNTSITENEYIKWQEVDKLLRLSVQSYGDVWIDDLKVGFTPQVTLKRDGKQVYIGYDGKLDDKDVVDDVKPGKVKDIEADMDSNKNLKISFTCEDLGRDYTYTATSKDRVNNVSDVSFPVVATVKTGIAGYSYVISKEPTDEPDNTIDIKDATFTRAMLQEDGYYLHIKAIDNAGNIGETVHHRLPYKTSFIPELRIDGVDYSNPKEPLVDLAWSLDILPSQTFWNTGFEKEDEANIDFIYNRSNPNERKAYSYTTDAFSGNQAITAVPSAPGLGNLVQPPDYVPTSSHNVWFRNKGLSANHKEKISIIYRLKTTKDANVVVRGTWQYEKLLHPANVTVVGSHKKGAKIVKLSDTSTVKPRNHHVTFISDPNNTSGTHTYNVVSVDKANNTIELDKGLTSDLASGTPMSYRRLITMFGENDKYINTNGKWSLINFNSEVSDNKYVDWPNLSTELRIVSISEGNIMIDDLKVGFATKVRLCRTDLSNPIYEGYDAQYYDDALDKGVPTAISNVKTSLENDETIKMTFSSTDSGTRYGYNISSISKNGKEYPKSDTVYTTITTGIGGYSYLIDRNEASIPDNKVNVIEGNISIPIPREDGYYIHIRAVDKAGNAGTTKHYKLPYIESKIDGYNVKDSSNQMVGTLRKNSSYKLNVQVIKNLVGNLLTEVGRSIDINLKSISSDNVNYKIVAVKNGDTQELNNITLANLSGTVLASGSKKIDILLQGNGSWVEIPFKVPDDETLKDVILVVEVPSINGAVTKNTRLIVKLPIINIINPDISIKNVEIEPNGSSESSTLLFGNEMNVKVTLGSNILKTTDVNVELEITDGDKTLALNEKAYGISKEKSGVAYFKYKPENIGKIKVVASINDLGGSEKFTAKYATVTEPKGPEYYEEVDIKSSNKLNIPADIVTYNRVQKRDMDTIKKDYHDVHCQKEFDGSTKCPGHEYFDWGNWYNAFVPVKQTAMSKYNETYKISEILFRSKLTEEGKSSLSGDGYINLLDAENAKLGMVRAGNGFDLKIKTEYRNNLPSIFTRAYSPNTKPADTSWSEYKLVGNIGDSIPFIYNEQKGSLETQISKNSSAVSFAVPIMDDIILENPNQIYIKMPDETYLIADEGGISYDSSVYKKIELSDTINTEITKDTYSEIKEFAMVNKESNKRGYYITDNMSNKTYSISVFNRFSGYGPTSMSKLHEKRDFNITIKQSKFDDIKEFR